METAFDINILAQEYLDFKRKEETLDFSDSLIQYEALNKKMDDAGISFYEIAKYAKNQSGD